jgi:hypothetical protein
VDRWLPELHDPVVVRTPASSVDDVVPVSRSITVFDLLTSRAGYGFPSDFTLPAVERLMEVQKDGREPQSFPPPDVWMALCRRFRCSTNPATRAVRHVLDIARCAGQQGLLSVHCQNS